MVASVPELLKRHSGRPNRRASSSDTSIAVSVGWAKWVPRPTCARTASTMAGCRVAGQAGAVASVQVDVLVAVDVEDLRAGAVADPDRLGRRDLPARGDSTGQGVPRAARAWPGSSAGARRRPAPPEAMRSSNVDPTCSAVDVSDATRFSYCRSRLLTECSVYGTLRSVARMTGARTAVGGDPVAAPRREDEAVTRHAPVEFTNVVAGRAVAARAGGRRAIENPATGACYAHATDSDAADVDVACEAAASAFPGWSTTTPAERSAAMLRAADVIEAHADELARIEVADTGKPLRGHDPGRTAPHRRPGPLLRRRLPRVQRPGVG